MQHTHTHEIVMLSLFENIVSTMNDELATLFLEIIIITIRTVDHTHTPTFNNPTKPKKTHENIQYKLMIISFKMDKFFLANYANSTGIDSAFIIVMTAVST